MKPYDMAIPKSFEVAKEKGLAFTFEVVNLRDAHPNTAVITVTGESGRTLTIQGSSVGGGRIVINEIDGVLVNFTGEKHTLIVNNSDQPGAVNSIAALLLEQKINIATMQLFREKRGGFAVMVIEIDQEIDGKVLERAEQLDGILKITYLKAVI